METNVSTLLREFPKVRRAALRGETVIVHTREGDLRITANNSGKPPLLGCLAGKMSLTGDITEPSTHSDEWTSGL